MSDQYILTLSCPDQVGIVSTVTSFIAQLGGNIISSSQHGEPQSNTFFMRIELDKNTLKIDIDTFRNDFTPIANQFNMNWNIQDAAVKKRMVLMVSKQSHCLSDLLYRWRSGDIYCDIPCVISNHQDMEDYVKWHGIPYYHVPMNSNNKAQAFEKINSIIQEHAADVIVLARFMQIIPSEMCQQYYGKMINIHHSFLPAFIGADPYKKAFEKGVKLVGATCHYVTENLDEGPIIEQDVMRINHQHTNLDIRRLGKDVEKNVLGRGVRYHLNDKVIIHGNKTVVF